MPIHEHDLGCLKPNHAFIVELVSLRFRPSGDGFNWKSFWYLSVGLSPIVVDLRMTTPPLLDRAKPASGSVSFPGSLEPSCPCPLRLDILGWLWLYGVKYACPMMLLDLRHGNKAHCRASAFASNKPISRTTQINFSLFKTIEANIQARFIPKHERAQGHCGELFRCMYKTPHIIFSKTPTLIQIPMLPPRGLSFSRSLGFSSDQACQGHSAFQTPKRW